MENLFLNILLFLVLFLMESFYFSDNQLIVYRDSFNF